MYLQDTSNYLKTEAITYKYDLFPVKFKNIKLVPEISEDESDESPAGIYILNQYSQQTEEKDLTSKQFKCGICNKSFTRKVGLRHLRIHSDEKPFECSVCKKSFNQKSHLKSHLQSKSFSQKSSLNIHLRVHNNEKPYKCSLCDMSFTQKSNLNLHVRYHSNEKPFKCSICNKSFTEKCTLTRHIRVHTNERPFHCCICTKSFTVKSSLNKHLPRKSTNHNTFIFVYKHYLCDLCTRVACAKARCSLVTKDRKSTELKEFSMGNQVKKSKVDHKFS
ncbi:hypothetical protein L9F63_011634, partial [Diploptera punctata]